MPNLIPLAVNSLLLGVMNSTNDQTLVQAPNLIQAIFLGFVQGFTEFLPISSTAHLKVIPVALGWGDPGVTFTAITQLGSIVAVVWYFWRDLAQITKGSLKAISRLDYNSSDFRLAVGIALGTLPIVTFGVLIKLFLPNYNNSPLRGLTAIAITSIGLAILLGFAERFGHKNRDFSTVNIWDSIWMGLAQTLSLIPGVSRSGSTFTAGLALGLEREATARLSFLLGIPSITLAGLAELPDALQAGWSDANILPLVAGTLSSAVFSYLAIVWLLRFLQDRSLWVFVWYRVGFGLAILLAIA